MRRLMYTTVVKPTQKEKMRTDHIDTARIEHYLTKMVVKEWWLVMIDVPRKYGR